MEPANSEPAGPGFDSRDPFNLARFEEAQSRTFAAALSEIRQGRKRTHWMWYIFPQVAGLGQSEMSRRYAIGSLAEARAYLAHPVLGVRLRMCVAALQDFNGATAEQLFGQVDAQKLCSSLTLFVQAGGGQMFDAALERWFGSRDPMTLQLLRNSLD